MGYASSARRTRSAVRSHSEYPATGAMPTSRHARMAHRDGDGGKPGARREQLIVVAARRVEIADEPRRVAPGRIDQGVELHRVHQQDDRGAKLLAEFIAGLTAGRLSRRIVGGLP